MATKKYINLNNLSTFLTVLRETFAEIGHKHSISDVTDYVVDTELSATSNNPVQNNVINTEFEAVATAMNALESAIDGKADSTHSHTIANVTNLQSILNAKVPTSRTVNGKALTANISLSASDVGAADSTHTHDDRYYTESEIDSKLSGKSDSTHNHDDRYYTESEIDSKLSGIQTEIDNKSQVQIITWEADD